MTSGKIFIIYQNNPNVNTKYDRHNKGYSDQIKSENDIIDITHQVSKIVKESKIENGVS